MKAFFAMLFAVCMLGVAYTEINGVIEQDRNVEYWSELNNGYEAIGVINTTETEYLSDEVARRLGIEKYDYAEYWNPTCIGDVVYCEFSIYLDGVRIADGTVGLI